MSRKLHTGRMRHWWVAGEIGNGDQFIFSHEHARKSRSYTKNTLFCRVCCWTAEVLYTFWLFEQVLGILHAYKYCTTYKEPTVSFVAIWAIAIAYALTRPLSFTKLADGFTQKSPGFGFVHVQVEMRVDCACVEQQSKCLAANDVRRHHSVRFPVDNSGPALLQSCPIVDDQYLPITYHTRRYQCVWLLNRKSSYTVATTTTINTTLASA